MPRVKWDKSDVIKKFQEAIAGAQLGGGSGVLKNLLDRAKTRIRRPGEGETPPVT